ncbi:hypothetical protein ACFL2T_05890, partial [Elusimicrobiota bacterium]
MSLRKIVASVCAAALGISCPGLGCYEAAARVIAAAPAAQAGIAGQVGAVGAASSYVGTLAPLAGPSLLSGGALFRPSLPGVGLPVMRTGLGPTPPALLTRTSLPLPTVRSLVSVRGAEGVAPTRKDPHPTLKTRLSGLVSRFRSPTTDPG